MSSIKKGIKDYNTQDFQCTLSNFREEACGTQNPHDGQYWQPHLSFFLLFALKNLIVDRSGLFRYSRVGMF